jgi:2-phospho-L-lactate transferase/gluconeogenesis factor (CofD/UPF0052 family)
VVALGGGTGLSSLLSGLKHYPYDLTAVVTVFDSGRHTGRLRQQAALPAMGDLRKGIASLSGGPCPLTQQLVEYRFVGEQWGDMEGACLGNLILAALADLVPVEDPERFGAGVAEASRILSLRGTVLPVTLDNTQICAELEGEGEGEEGADRLDGGGGDGGGGNGGGGDGGGGDGGGGDGGACSIAESACYGQHLPRKRQKGSGQVGQATTAATTAAAVTGGIRLVHNKGPRVSTARGGEAGGAVGVGREAGKVHRGRFVCKEEEVRRVGKPAIKRVFLGHRDSASGKVVEDSPDDVKVYPPVLEAIRSADAIVLAAGSLYVFCIPLSQLPPQLQPHLPRMICQLHLHHRHAARPRGCRGHSGEPARQGDLL